MVCHLSTCQAQFDIAADIFLFFIKNNERKVRGSSRLLLLRLFFKSGREEEEQRLATLTWRLQGPTWHRLKARPPT